MDSIPLVPSWRSPSGFDEMGVTFVELVYLKPDLMVKLATLNSEADRGGWRRDRKKFIASWDAVTISKHAFEWKNLWYYLQSRDEPRYISNVSSEFLHVIRILACWWHIRRPEVADGVINRVKILVHGGATLQGCCIRWAPVFPIKKVSFLTRAAASNYWHFQTSIPHLTSSCSLPAQLALLGDP